MANKKKPAKKLAPKKAKKAAKSIAKRVVKTLAQKNPLLGLSNDEVFRRIRDLEDVAQIAVRFEQHGQIALIPDDFDEEDIQDGLFGDAVTLNNCCGIVEIGELHAPEEFPRTLAKGQIQLLVLGSLHHSLNSFNRNMAVATTTHKQLKEAEILAAIGFLPVGKTVNPGSGNTITLWTFTRG